MFQINLKYKPCKNYTIKKYFRLDTLDDYFLL